MKYITVTVEEAVNAMNHTPADLYLYAQLMLHRLRRDYAQRLPEDDGAAFAFALAALFNAGRIQGIREERAKHGKR